MWAMNLSMQSAPVYVSSYPLMYFELNLKWVTAQAEIGMCLDLDVVLLF